MAERAMAEHATTDQAGTDQTRPAAQENALGSSVNIVQLSTRQIRIVHELLIACGRYHFSKGTKSKDRPAIREAARRIRELVADDVTWSYLSRVIARQGVEPLVYHVLGETSDDLLPTEVLSNIEAYRRGASIRNTFAVDELWRVVQTFEAHGVPVLAFKGPVLAKVAYGDVHLRRYTDLDLLVAPHHLTDAEALLRDQGYAPFTKVQRLGPVRKTLYHVLSGQRPFRRGGGTFNIDLHTQLMPPGLSYPASFAELWDRSEPVTLKPGAVPRDALRRISDEDMLQVLCFHGVKNQWAALKYVWDIAALIAAHPIRWSTVVEQVRDAQAERIVGMGLQLAHRVGGTPVPDEVLERLALPQSLRDLVDTLAGHFMDSTHELALSYTERIRFYLLLQNTLWNKVRYVLYSAARNVWSAWIK